MLDGSVVSLPLFKTKGQHSISGLSSGAFMTVQMSIAHSKTFMGAGIIAGGPYRTAEIFLNSGPTIPTSCILNSLYIAMTPLTESTSPSVAKLLAMAENTDNIDDLSNIAAQKIYIFTGSKDRVVNQYAVKSTLKFYKGLGVPEEHIRFVDNVPAGHSIITKNPEDSPLSANQPPYINRGDFVQSHDILNHIYPNLNKAAKRPLGHLIRFDQTEFLGNVPSDASMAPLGYAYIPSKVATNEATALGVHVVMHGCKQGYQYTNFINGLADVCNQAPYGDRYVTTTGYLEMAEANNILLLFPQVGGEDNNAIQNPDGCWDWWGYTASNPFKPDYYSKNAIQIKAIYSMLERLGGI